MRKKVIHVFLAISLFLGISSNVYSDKPIKIGILIPIEHAALRDIVAGFEKVVKEAFPNNVIFNVQSAQGDLKLQKNIIDLFVGQNFDMIVPIGTSATQMTLSQVKEIPIVSLAAMYPETERQKRVPRNITGVLDEISSQKKLQFIRGILPDAKTITLIYHIANEKTHQEVIELQASAKEMGITLQTIVIHNLPDLETAGHAVAPDSKAIFILKDHLIASGIRILIPIAKSRGIPLITSDEGTVKEGATFALGVQERMIGEEGAALAVKVLKGSALCFFSTLSKAP